MGMKQLADRDCKRAFINMLKLLKKHKPKEERHGENMSKTNRDSRLENKISEINFH